METWKGVDVLALLIIYVIEQTISNYIMDMSQTQKHDMLIKLIIQFIVGMNAFLFKFQITVLPPCDTSDM